MGALPLHTAPRPAWGGRVIYQHVDHYLGLGLTVLPVVKRGVKRPVGFRWKRLQDAKLHAIESSRGRSILTRFYQHAVGLFAVCGRASEGLFVIDCETPDAADMVGRQLIARQIAAPMVRTGGGGAHYYMKARHGAVKTIPLTETADAIEIRGAGAGVMMPPSVHPTGALYQWEGGLLAGEDLPRSIPFVDIEDIDFLTDTDGKPLALERVGGGRHLHIDTLDYLTNGAQLTEGTRRTRCFRAAHDYAYNGYSLAHAYRDFMPIATASGLDRQEAARAISEGWNGYGKKSDSKQQRRETVQAKLEAYFTGYDFSALRGRSNRALIEGMLQRRAVDTHNYANGIFRGSHRELRSASAIGSADTVRNALETLQEAGLIERVRLADVPAQVTAAQNLRAGRGGYALTEKGASLWRFTDSVVLAAKDTADAASTDEPMYLYHPRKNPDSALADSAALGRSTYRVYAFLQRQDEPAKAAAIADAVGLATGSIYYHLNKLRDSDLLEKHGTRYSVVSNVVSISALRADGMEARQERNRRIDEERAIDAIKPIARWLDMVVQKMETERRKAQRLQRQRQRLQPPTSGNSEAVTGFIALVDHTAHSDSDQQRDTAQDAPPRSNSAQDAPTVDEINAMLADAADQRDHSDTAPPIEDGTASAADERLLSATRRLQKPADDSAFLHGLADEMGATVRPMDTDWQHPPTSETPGRVDHAADGSDTAPPMDEKTLQRQLLNMPRRNDTHYHREDE